MAHPSTHLRVNTEGLDKKGTIVMLGSYVPIVGFADHSSPLSHWSSRHYTVEFVWNKKELRGQKSGTPYKVLGLPAVKFQHRQFQHGYRTA